MSKQILTIQNLRNGEFVQEVNDAILQATGGLLASNNPKGKATVAVTLELKPYGKDGVFVEVTPSVAVKIPTAAKEAELMAIGEVDGVRGVVTDAPVPAPDQPKLPGVASLADKRAANA